MILIPFLFFSYLRNTGRMTSTSFSCVFFLSLEVRVLVALYFLMTENVEAARFISSYSFEGIINAYFWQYTSLIKILILSQQTPETELFIWFCVCIYAVMSRVPTGLFETEFVINLFIGNNAWSYLDDSAD